MWVEVLLIAFAAGIFGFGMARRDKTSRARAAEQERRMWLTRLISRKPGARLGSLERAAQTPRNTLKHHLRILERCELIAVDRSHGPTRYYPTPELAREAGAIAVLRGRMGLLARQIRALPGHCQLQLAKILRLSRKTFRAHADQLKAEGLVLEMRDKNRQRYFPTERLEKIIELVGEDLDEEFDREASTGVEP